jgi:flagellar basal body rod protein FlgF
MKKISVLGTPYTVRFANKEEEPGLKISDGYYDYTSKQIVIDEMTSDKEENSLDNLKYHQRKVIRHELIHAFITESGLRECSEWALNEEMVDFFARQFEKMYKAFKEADALEDNI